MKSSFAFEHPASRKRGKMAQVALFGGRPMRREVSAVTFLILGLLLAGSPGCSGSKSQSNTPVIFVSQNSLPFGTVFGNGTYIGTRIPNSVDVQNQGIQDLVISS